jgi:Holliday junction resolvasome RuvABC ATP-dependent DNA helicase subunit
MSMDEADFDDAMLFGTGYAFYRHGQDRLAADISQAIRAALSEWDPIVVTGGDGEEQRRTTQGVAVAPVNLERSELLGRWKDYIGQVELIEELQLRVDSARLRHGRIPHMLLSSDASGMGRRAAVRLAARQLGKKLIELSSPFTIDQLATAADLLDYADILFIDDLERISESRGVGPGAFASMLEEQEVLAPGGTSHFLDEVSVVASTTQLDAVPSSVLDRFPIQLPMAPYGPCDLGRLAVTFAFAHRSEDLVSDELAGHIALLCEGSGPADVERLVLLIRDLAVTLGRPPDVDELVRGMERQSRFR